MRRAFLWMLLLIGPLCALAEDNLAAPPAGIAPTSITLKRLFALHRAAVGAAPSAEPKTRTETWAYKEGSLSGAQTLAASGKDFREDTTIGPFHSASGRRGTKMWEQNRNGLIRTIAGVHQRDVVNAHALTHALSPDSGVTLLGEVNMPARAFVVKADPKGGRIEYVFYDAASYLVIRDESVVEGRRVVYTYDDFRETDGVKEAWHVHKSNGLPNDDNDWQLQSLNAGKPIEPFRLDIPASLNPVSLTADRVLLPAKIGGDRIILTVQLGSHKVNLQLDSGASGILLNRAVADATGVQSFGKKTEITAGKYSASDALIPKIDFGVGTMQNVAAETAPYAEMSYDSTPVAGLIGYDFIATSVLHIDYYNGTVEAIAPNRFVPPAGAVRLPIRLDDGVPVVTARIGSAAGNSFIVDTGADRSMIFSGFAREHPLDIADQGMGDTMRASFPFGSKISGVGGKVNVRPVQVQTLDIGSITFPKWLFDVSQDAASFEGDDYDGLIGQDVLRNFDVYLDYPHEMIYLVPNDRYKQRWGSG